MFGHTDGFCELTANGVCATRKVRHPGTVEKRSAAEKGLDAVVEAPPQGRLHKRMERLLSVIGSQEWLDRPSYRLEHLVAIAFNALGNSRDRIANALNGVWLGHPVHPPLA